MLPLPQEVFAANYDFHIENNMEIRYETKNKYVTVQIEYIREVVNNDYYFPASGTKVFPIPDLSSSTEAELEQERKLKRESVSVKDPSGEDVAFSIEEDEEGLNIVVPNYKQTTRNSPYRIYVSYNTHDYIQVINQNIIIQAPALPEDTQFEVRDEETKTTTSVDYGLMIVVDKETAPLSKIWPSGYTLDPLEEFDNYVFPPSARINKNPYLEFGTSQIFRFELEYVTPKTDSFLPEKYSDLFNALSTNIYEISLPRNFDETKQEVKIESISPTPTKIGIDEEGNIIATFEVNANQEGKISVIGYIWVEQEALQSRRTIPDISLSDYSDMISGDVSFQKYLGSTKYWEVSDPYIKKEADSIKSQEDTLEGLIRADYRYINEKLEYDQSKANSINDRIGAKQALQGEAAVCMEYADAMITLLRAQGIPSRAAIGYANLRDASETLDSQVRHQWVQVWVPDYGWLSVDPTLESENMDIGANIQKVLWETFNGDDLSNTKIYSADSLDTINDIEFNITVYAVEEKDIENMNELRFYQDILAVEDISEDESFGDQLNKFVKASSIGRSMAIVIPILLIILLLIVIITIVRAIITSVRKKKESSKI
jgi:transglutaminase-like putative cysteine protease